MWLLALTTSYAETSPRNIEKPGVKKTMAEAGVKLIHKHPHSLPFLLSDCFTFSLTAIPQDPEAILNKKKNGLCELANMML